MMKIIQSIIIGLAALFLLLLALLLTPAGLDISLTIAKRVLPGELHYRQVTGTLLGPITFKDLSYRSSQFQFTVDRLQFNWGISALFDKQLLISQLKAESIYLILPPDNQPLPNTYPEWYQYIDQLKKHISQIQLPFALKIKQAEFSDIHVRYYNGPDFIVVPNLYSHLSFASHQLDAIIQTQISKPISLNIYFHLDGQPNQYLFRLEWHDHTAKGVAVGNGDNKQINIQFHGSQQLGLFQGKLQTTWTPQWSYQIELKGSDLNLKSIIHPQFPFIQDLNLKSNGQLFPQRPQFNADVELNANDSQAKLNITYQQQLQIQWQLQIQQLASLFKSWRGQINSRGNFQGTWNNPLSQGQLVANNVKTDDLSVQTLTAHWQIANTQQPSNLQIFANQFSWHNLLFKSLQTNLSGTLNHHQIHGTAQTISNTINWIVDGRYQSRQWSGLIKQLIITDRNTGQWQSTQPSRVEISQQKLFLDRTCLQHGIKDKLCLNGQYQFQNDQWQIQADSSSIDARFFSFILPQNFQLAGVIQLNLSALGKGPILQTLNSKISLNQGNINYIINGSTRTIQLAQALLNSELTKNGLQTDLIIKTDKQDQITAKFLIPQFSQLDQINPSTPIRGEVHLETKQLQRYANLFPYVTVQQGQFIGYLTISGSVIAPQLSGKAELSGVVADIPTLGVHLSQFSGNLTGNKNSLQFALQAFSAGRPLFIHGTVDLSPGFPITATVTGDQVLVANIPEYQVYASPNLKIDFKNKKLLISGEIAIPKARIQPREFRFNTITLPTSDIVITQGGRLYPEQPLAFATDIIINLGPDVVLKIRDGQGNLSGKVHIAGEANRPKLATGQINIIDGIYNLYDKALTISPTSNISYTKSLLTRPTLNISATRSISTTAPIGQQQIATYDQILVGIQIRGTYPKTNVTLFSQPATLSQADILSYLVLGYPASDIKSTGEANYALLLQALDTLKLDTGQNQRRGLPSIIRQGLGFQELGIESQTVLDAVGNPTGRQTSFVIGRYLSRRIYIRYSIGLSGLLRADVLSIRYFLSPNWYIQLENATSPALSSGNAQGIDIVYTIQSR